MKVYAVVLTCINITVRVAGKQTLVGGSHGGVKIACGGGVTVGEGVAREADLVDAGGGAQIHRNTTFLEAIARHLRSSAIKVKFLQV